jgi:hypothetical protein
VFDVSSYSIAYPSLSEASQSVRRDWPRENKKGRLSGLRGASFTSLCIERSRLFKNNWFYEQSTGREPQANARKNDGARERAND